MGKARPPAGRPPGRRGRGGKGPGPEYRPSRTGGGTTHKSSSVEGSPIIRVVYGIAGFVACTIGGTVVLALHVYGVI